MFGNFYILQWYVCRLYMNIAVFCIWMLRWIRISSYGAFKKCVRNKNSATESASANANNEQQRRICKLWNKTKTVRKWNLSAFWPIVIPTSLVKYPFMIPLFPTTWKPHHVSVRWAPPMSFYPEISVISRAPLVISGNPHGIAVRFSDSNFFFYWRRRTDVYSDTDMELCKSWCRQCTNCQNEYEFQYCFHNSPLI